MTGPAISRSAARLAKHFAADESGATAIEYAMIAAGVGVAISSTVWGLGSTLKTGVANELPPIDTCELAISLGATFVGRSFSGDKRQLHSMLKAAIAHKGTVLLDVISPCVTFNDHEGSTKSYKYAKDHDEPLQEINFIPSFEDIAVEYDPGTTVQVTMHDGSRLQLRKLEEDYDPTDKIQAITRLNEAKKDG